MASALLGNPARLCPLKTRTFADERAGPPGRRDGYAGPTTH